MAIEDIIGLGIGFAGGTHLLPTLGFATAGDVALTITQRGGMWTARVIDPPAGEYFFIFVVDGMAQGATRNTQITRLLSENEEHEIVCFATLAEGYPPTALPVDAMPARRILTWARSTDANVRSYRLEYATGNATPGANDWIAFALTPDSGAWLYEALTPRLSDLTWYWFRIVPLDEGGNPGTALTLGPEYFIRRPTPPALSATFSDGTDRVTFA